MRQITLRKMHNLKPRKKWQLIVAGLFHVIGFVGTNAPLDPSLQASLQRVHRPAVPGPLAARELAAAAHP